MIEFGENITLEALPQVSWLVRRRTHDAAIKAPYGWVASVVRISDSVCEVKGYLPKDGHEMTTSERREMARICNSLGFSIMRYERYDKEGNLRIAHEINTHKYVRSD